MQKDPNIFLIHILESIGWIEKEIIGSTKEKFFQNVPIQDAVIRRLEVIGEAVKNLPTEFRKQHQDIVWQKISGLRDKLDS